MTPTPTRILSLDVLRGVALLGILLMNIQSFALPLGYYNQPWASEGLGGYWLYILTRVVIDQKMFALFAALFGAGIALQHQRLATALGPGDAWRIHARRMLILLAMGLAHAYLLWYGDILVTYALCGLLLYPLLRLSTPHLLVVALLILAVAPVMMFLDKAPVDQPALQAFRHTIDALDVAQVSSDAETAAMRRPWLGQLPLRARLALSFQTHTLLIYSLWRTLGAMALGVVAWRLGGLTATRPSLYYLLAAAVALPVGLVLTFGGLLQRPELGAWLVQTLSGYCGSLALAAGYAALVMLACRHIRPALLHPLACVGRMALTNYLLQSLICTWIFYGHGLNCFGHLARAPQLFLALAIALTQLLLSTLWLSRYPQGPMEHLWRRLTYR